MPDFDSGGGNSHTCSNHVSPAIPVSYNGSTMDSDSIGGSSILSTGANAIGLETLLLLFSWEVGLELHPLKSEPLARFGSLR